MDHPSVKGRAQDSHPVVRSGRWSLTVSVYAPECAELTPSHLYGYLFDQHRLECDHTSETARELPSCQGS